MDDGTRISEEVEKFLRAARVKDVTVCASMLEANPGLVDTIEAGGFSALHFAAFNGDVDLMQLLFKYHATVDAENYDGNTPLIMAAKGNQKESTRLLIDAGAAVNFETSTGGTAAHFAASMGYVDLVRYLVSLGASVQHTGETGSLVHWAAHSGDVNCVGAMIYEFGVDVDITDKHGGTALFTALFMKKTDVVQFLLEHGANQNATIPGDGSTPLHIAVEHSGFEDVKLLVAFDGDALATNSEGETPLSLAEKAKKDRAVKELSKPRLSKEERAAEATRFKEQGNKVFGNGENVKAARFYSMAIRMDKTNHVFFSNRAACYFNQGVYKEALWDACRCIQLAPQWPKGYLRKAVTLMAMKQYAESLKAADHGLTLDAKNKDLQVVREEVRRHLTAQ